MDDSKGNRAWLGVQAVYPPVQNSAWDPLRWERAVVFQDGLQTVARFPAAMLLYQLDGRWLSCCFSASGDNIPATQEIAERRVGYGTCLRRLAEVARVGWVGKKAREVFARHSSYFWVRSCLRRRSGAANGQSNGPAFCNVDAPVQRLCIPMDGWDKSRVSKDPPWSQTSRHHSFEFLGDSHDSIEIAAFYST
jgi:hypothetical protein